MIRKSERLKEIIMEKNNDKPKLRFPGFTDPSEQRKLNHLQDKKKSLLQKMFSKNMNLMMYIITI